MKYKTERRRFERVKANLEAHWEGVSERESGTVVDLSRKGCFILTANQVETGELIRINIGDIYIWGEVIYQIEEMGFAIRFNAALGDQEAQLGEMIEAMKEDGTASKQEESQVEPPSSLDSNAPDDSSS